MNCSKKSATFVVSCNRTLNSMRIGIYCRQLITLGGGSRYALTIAESLSKHHDVDLLTNTPYAADQISSRYNLDLSRVQLRAVPEYPASALEMLTGKYDLFINALNREFVRSQSPKSVLIVFFPLLVNEDLLAWLRRRVALFTNRFLKGHHFASGFMAEEPWQDGAKVRLFSSPATLLINATGRNIGLTFRLQNLACESQDVHLYDGDRLLHSDTVPGGGLSNAVEVAMRARPVWSRHELSFITEAIDGRHQDSSISASMALSDFVLHHPSYRLYQWLFDGPFAHWRERLNSILPADLLDRVASYDALWTTSSFTAHWIKRYWGCTSHILNPLVEIEEFSSRAKKKQILSVGRFFSGSHNKKHKTLIAAFRDMIDRGLEEWTLVLAGGVIDEPDHLRYLREVRSAAAGYPIEIVTNLPFERLARLYGESAIYWHATGFGEDENTSPVTSEHFGITTVEAMAAGCVPVVIGKGGQPEIVRDAVDGYLWSTLNELKEKTLWLVHDEDLCHQMSKRATERSRRFGRASFEHRLNQLMLELQ